MKQDIQRIMLAAAKPLFPIFILYILKIMEVGMDWDFSRLGVYPMEKRGLVGILTHPLIHSGFSHLLANTIPLFFLSWCLFYFYRGIAGKIFILIWLGGGLLTFLIGKPGWHIGASGLIYGLAFFLFFSGILRKYIPLIAISLLVTFLYGGIIWHMFPYFSPTNMSWEGHLSGGIMGTLCAFVFVNHGPQRPEPFADEMEEEENTEEEEDAGYKPSIFFDFDTGDFVTLHDGKLKEASGFEAWVQWCYKTIMTQRYAHEGYSTDIGIDYESALQADSREEAESILQREIEEALMADPSERTLYVGNIMFQWEAEHCLVTVQVQGIDGDIEIQTQFESEVV